MELKERFLFVLGEMTGLVETPALPKRLAVELTARGEKLSRAVPKSSRAGVLVMVIARARDSVRLQREFKKTQEDQTRALMKCKPEQNSGVETQQVCHQKHK